MNSADAKDRSTKKFLFDTNNFDDGAYKVEVEDLPPLFTEEQLEAAKKEAHANGRLEAKREADRSREQTVAALLKTLSQSIHPLIVAESERSAQFEAESVRLSLSLFQKVFPTLNIKQGMKEIESVIRSVLEERHGQAEIIIEVYPDYADSIREYVNSLMRDTHGAGHCTVKDNAALGASDCRLSWGTGGGSRNAERLAAQIAAQIEQMLAGKPALPDNEGTGTPTDGGTP